MIHAYSISIVDVMSATKFTDRICINLDIIINTAHAPSVSIMDI